MYAYIRGKMVSTDGNVAVVDVGGIGYEISVSTNTAVKLPARDKEVTLFTYLNVREDEFSLYGFLRREEKEMFLKLITISGIGPRAAIGILSGMELGALAIAIATADVKSIAKIKGVGKKTAERIVLELKEKLRGEDTTFFTENVVSLEEAGGMVQDAVNALRTLGLTQAEALSAVNASRAEADTLEELIMCALRRINK